MTPSEKLPAKPSLRQLRNRAKDLLRALQAGEPDAIRRIGESHPRYSGSSQAEIAAAEMVLADAQLVIARESGFDSWPRLKTHIESLSQPATSMHRLVTGDNLQAMREAVARDPESVNQPNESGLPPLYTAALFRNRPAIDFLLEHGAVVDIFACAYLGKATDAEILLKSRSRSGEGNHAGRHDRLALRGASRPRRCRRHPPTPSFRRECPRSPRPDGPDGSVSRRAMEARAGRRNHPDAARSRRTGRPVPGRGDGSNQPDRGHPRSRRRLDRRSGRSKGKPRCSTPPTTTASPR